MNGTQVVAFRNSSTVTPTTSQTMDITGPLMVLNCVDGVNAISKIKLTNTGSVTKIPMYLSTLAGYSSVSCDDNSHGMRLYTAGVLQPYNVFVGSAGFNDASDYSVLPYGFIDNYHLGLKTINDFAVPTSVVSFGNQLVSGVGLSSLATPSAVVTSQLFNNTMNANRWVVNLAFTAGAGIPIGTGSFALTHTENPPASWGPVILGATIATLYGGYASEITVSLSNIAYNFYLLYDVSCTISSGASTNAQKILDCHVTHPVTSWVGT